MERWYNVSAEALLTFRRNDSSNQLGNDPNGDGTPYSDISSYQSVLSLILKTE
ncbi:MAG: hypothetical protein F6K18_09020 [Okeania sp. SIO2C2]|uniref:DUF6851 domain-containing protein n=1 Tax=Okeania sp. SIO2C2 TaxID=2607787 RepID=UPI0013B977FA|nr:hypothetical protein [Okeania sp. SIO2C2]NEP86965.1 hypothetical protein [Okeania sp. SIO2C2]